MGNKISYLFLLLLLTLFSCSDNEPEEFNIEIYKPTDWEKYGFKGKVNKIKYSTYFVGVDGTRGNLSFMSTYDFNESGTLIKRDTKNGYGELEHGEVREIDDLGRVSKKEYIGKSGTDIDFVLYEYDESNNVTKETQYLSETIPYLIIESIYDEKNRIIEMKDILARDPSVFTTSVFEYVGSSIVNKVYDKFGKLYYKYVSKYNSLGKLLESRYYNSNNKFIEKDYYKYDKNGNVIEKGFYTGGTIQSKTVYTYEADILLETIRYENGKKRSKTTYSYENGLKASIAYKYDKSAMEVLDFKNSYDEYGNVIESKTYGGGRITHITIYEIEYF